MLRKEFKYPPFVRILYINTKSKEEKKLIDFNDEKYKELRIKLNKFIEKGLIRLYKPVPKGIYKVNKEYQIDTIIKTKKDVDQEVKNILRKVYFNKSYKSINITLEIDPNIIS
jgi:primosomal protein N' (replication factor Y)